MSSAHTPWFPVSIKPVRAGIYQVLPTSTQLISYSKFDGSKWLDVSPYYERAASYTGTSDWMRCSGAKWRGLAKESVAP